jgi:cytochrome c oxidase subunit II
MKRFLPLSTLASLLMLSACGAQPVDTTKITTDNSKEDSAMMKSDTTVITVTATNFAFTPNMIRVKKGEKVQLNFAGAEGYHGVAIKDLGINVSFAAGETKTINLPTDKAGTFAFRCSVPCGPGHRDMIGTIIIE